MPVENEYEWDFYVGIPEEGSEGFGVFLFRDWQEGVLFSLVIDFWFFSLHVDYANADIF
jgi:hypothetical protein